MAEYSLDEIDRLLAGYTYINTGSQPLTFHALMAPNGSASDQAQTTSIQTPLSSLQNSPSAELSIECDIETSLQHNAAFFGLKEYMRALRGFESGEQWPFQNGRLYGSAEENSNFGALMNMLSKPDEDCKSSDSLDLVNPYESITNTDDYDAGSETASGLALRNLKQHTKDGHGNVVYTQPQSLFASTQGDESEASRSLDTLVDAAVAVSSTNSSWSNLIGKGSTGSPPTYIPLNQLRFYDTDPAFTFVPNSVTSGNQMIGVPLFATQAHQPIQPIIHPQTMPGYQVISPPSTVQPSAIYYQPMIPPSAPASHAIVTPMESPVKHFSDSSTKLHHASVDSRYHPYRRGGSFTPSSAATPTTDAGSQEDKRRIAAEKMAAAAQKALMYSLSMESQAAASAAEGGGQRKRELQQQRRELRRRQPASPKVKHDTPVSNPSHSSDSIAARDSLSSGTPASVGTPSTSSQHLRKSRPNHKPNVTALLFKWLMEHQHEPYPNEEEKKMMSVETGLNLNQINDWFINARRRYL